ncbi:hypothetical protein PM082_003022 [Marasmius tenuissimus]|nr:hypothetical protein PM082_003022 [Marasmius tenuissimus]
MILVTSSCRPFYTASVIVDLLCKAFLTINIILCHSAGPDPMSRELVTRLTTITEQPIDNEMTFIDEHCGNQSCGCGDNCGCPAGECKCTKS